MALPRSLSAGLLPSEIEFVASTETEVSIVPRLASDRVRLLGGIYGPFKPPAQAKVPLWLAAYLKKRNKCTIVPPAWLTVEALSETLTVETNTASFAEVPFHYVAIAKVLLDVAADDIPSSDQVRALLKDLREARQSKIMAGLEMINPVHLEMTNISALEIAELRPFFSTAFKELRAFQRQAAIADGTSAAAAAPPGGLGAGGYGVGVGGEGHNEGGLMMDESWSGLHHDGAWRTTSGKMGASDKDDAMDFEGGTYGHVDDVGGRRAAGGGGDGGDDGTSRSRSGYASRGGAHDRETDAEDRHQADEHSDEEGVRPAGRRPAAPVVEEYEMD